MNANINYDEIPDTSAVQEDLLAALSSQHVTVHTNEEPDFDYMENVALIRLVTQRVL